MKTVFLDILMILGSLALFIYGMKVMSDGIQKAAGETLRNRLQSLAKNRTRGVLTGLLTTSLLQSSSATTVMIVSFVNAGLISLSQSVPVIFGANIGTTITAWIVSIGGFVLSLQDLVLPLLVLAVPLFLRSKGKISYWGEFLIGFALLFMGLGFLQSSIPPLNLESELIVNLQRFTSMGLLSSFLFLFIGIIVTWILQSSSAAMTLTLTMVFNGWLPIELAAAMVLGENIGTTITAEIASLVGNIYARRSARIHTLFNVIGSLWMILLIPIIINGIDWFLIQFTGVDNPMSDPKYLTIGLSSFHTIFNILNALLLLSFIPFLIKIATITWPSDKKKQKKTHLKNIGTSRTPELSIVELKNETEHFAEMIEELMDLAHEYLNTLDKPKRPSLKKKIDKIISRSGKKEKRMAEYIRVIRQQELSAEAYAKVDTYAITSTRLKELAQIIQNMAEVTREKHENNIWFTPIQRNNLNDLFKLDEQLYTWLVKALINLDEGKDNEKIEEYALRISELCNQYQLESEEAKEDFDYSAEGTRVYLSLIHFLKELGDQITTTGKEWYD